MGYNINELHDYQLDLEVAKFACKKEKYYKPVCQDGVVYLLAVKQFNKFNPTQNLNQTFSVIDKIFGSDCDVILSKRQNQYIAIIGSGEGCGNTAAVALCRAFCMHAYNTGLGE